MGPPPIPKGTPHPMTLVAKPTTIPTGKVWVQGKLRDKASKAARDQQLREERKAEKVFLRSTVGQTVFAYHHIRTNQVVYSLTRFLEDTKVFPQLFYHGKKTVPSDLRKDLWTPYFSVHFPTSKHGLTAYRYLRELSALRQLDPPKSLLRSTMTTHFKFDADKMYNRDLEKDRPKIGRTLSRKLRARVLMDQKASSVADVAYVLGLQNEVGLDTPKAMKIPQDAKTPKSFKKAVRARQEAIANLQKADREQLAVAKNPSVEFSDLAKARIESAKQSKSLITERDASKDKIAVLWADMRDATYAKSWPKTVYHGELSNKLKVDVPSGFTYRSVHVIGNSRDVGGRPLPVETRDVVLPSKPLATRVKDALMFWRN